jgi:hypothetical protein
MAKVRRKAIDSNVFRSVVAFDGDELPLFAVHDERVFEGTGAEVF